MQHHSNDDGGSIDPEQNGVGGRNLTPLLKSTKAFKRIKFPGLCFIDASSFELGNLYSVQVIMVELLRVPWIEKGGASN